LIQPETHIETDNELATLLRNLKARFRIILLTNTRRQIAIRALLAMNLHENDFDLILAGGDFTEPKPSVETLRSALKTVNCEPTISYTVGDRWAVDHEPGQELGMHAILVQGRDEFVAWLKTMQVFCN
jgi:FMN phosphatase YigB (HAD superfamily)